jgi:hypothetical protein
LLVFVSHASEHWNGACESYSRLSIAFSSCIISDNIILHRKIISVDLSMVVVAVTAMMTMESRRRLMMTTPPPFKLIVLL